MANRNTETLTAFAITEKGESSYWTKIGAAFINKDGSINVELDALPVFGRLQIRHHLEREAPPERTAKRKRR
jgi:hypothetical protein